MSLRNSFPQDTSKRLFLCLKAGVIIIIILWMLQGKLKKVVSKWAAKILSEQAITIWYIGFSLIQLKIGVLRRKNLIPKRPSKKMTFEYTSIFFGYAFLFKLVELLSLHRNIKIPPFNGNHGKWKILECRGYLW